MRNFICALSITLSMLLNNSWATPMSPPAVSSALPVPFMTLNRATCTGFFDKEAKQENLISQSDSLETVVHIQKAIIEAQEMVETVMKMIGKYGAHEKSPAGYSHQELALLAVLRTLQYLFFKEEIATGSYILEVLDKLATVSLHIDPNESSQNKATTRASQRAHKMVLYCGDDNLTPVQPSQLPANFFWQGINGVYEDSVAKLYVYLSPQWKDRPCKSEGMYAYNAVAWKTTEKEFTTSNAFNAIFYCREAFTSARNRYIGRESVMLRQKFLKDDAAWKNAVLDKALKEGLPAAIHALFHHPIIHESLHKFRWHELTGAPGEDEKRTCNNADSVAYFVVSAYLLKQFTAPGTVQGQAQTQGAANAQNPIYMTAVNHEGHIQHVVYDTNKGFDDNYNELKRQLGLQKGPPSSSGSERNSGQNSRSNSPNSGTQGTPSQPPAPAPGKNLATDLGELTIGTTPKGTRKSGRSRSGSQTGGAPKY
ncbi:hypothetical protein EX30DRAFT_350733 [Ascodesmis nigricans]|uniref:Uncharacterized protein n=1 Tax=Ascodesmis nigricans TaxID=341454 RepID=A0A4S2MP27_9PEZI|nr:hypothetical protein EX30DRAFT_350733 [Ascodesmis nigricans]